MHLNVRAAYAYQIIFLTGAMYKSYNFLVYLLYVNITILCYLSDFCNK